MIALQHYLTLAAILFAMSIAGIFINRRNLIVLLMCIELMLLAVNFNFIAFSRYLGDETGQVFVFFILTVAAAEAAIGQYEEHKCPDSRNKTLPNRLPSERQTEFAS